MTVEGLNITDPGPETDNPNGEVPPPEHDWMAIFNAPDFASLVKPRVTAKSREYKAKSDSVLKTALVGALNAQNFHDAAAILAHGPQFSTAVGTLADADEKAARIIDIVTSPSNPYVLFAMSAITLLGQVYRNHEKAFNEAPGNYRANRARRREMRKAGAPKPPPRFTIKAFGRQWPVRFGANLRSMGFVLRGVRSQTQDPATLTEMVFTNPELIKALEKQFGIRLMQREAP